MGDKEIKMCRNTLLKRVLAVGAIAFGLIYNHAQANAEKDDTIKISAIDWCPFICPSDEEKPGVLVEYVREVYQRAGYEMSHKVFTFSRAIKNVEAGRYDAILSPTKSEAPSLRYPPSEVGAQRYCFFTRSDSDWVYSEPADLSGKQLVFPRDTLVKEIRKYVDIEESRELPYSGTYAKRAVKSLLGSKVDVLYLNYYTLRKYLKSTQQLDQVRIAGCVAKESLYLAFSPKEENQARMQKLIHVFEQGVRDIGISEFMKPLFKKYDMPVGFHFDDQAMGLPKKEK